MSQKVLVVFGGNGYIGQRVCASAVQSGSKVISISRSGLPPQISEEWVQQVQWKKGDISSPSTELTNIIKGANGAVSCVGAFGSNEEMLAINGEYNCNAIKLSKTVGIERFTFISSAPSTMPTWFLNGYYSGKINAEKVLEAEYKGNGTILRPGFVYGKRLTSIGTLPLHWIGAPLRSILKITKLENLSSWPGLSIFFTAPVSVEDVGRVAFRSAIGELPLARTGLGSEASSEIICNVFDGEGIENMAK